VEESVLFNRGKRYIAAKTINFMAFIKQSGMLCEGGLAMDHVYVQRTFFTAVKRTLRSTPTIVSTPSDRSVVTGQLHDEHIQTSPKNISPSVCCFYANSAQHRRPPAVYITPTFLRNFEPNSPLYISVRALAAERPLTLTNRIHRTHQSPRARSDIAKPRSAATIIATTR
jgi:hypothetical protein